MTNDWLIDYWTARANLDQMSEAQLWELIDFLQPHNKNLDIFRTWLAALLATEAT